MWRKDSGESGIGDDGWDVLGSASERGERGSGNDEADIGISDTKSRDVFDTAAGEMESRESKLDGIESGEQLLRSRDVVVDA